MKADNLQRERWNQTVDRALVSGVPEVQIIEVRKVEIGKKASQSICQSGSQPDLLAKIIKMAIKVLELLITQIINKVMQRSEVGQKKAEVVPLAERRATEVGIPEEQVPDKVSSCRKTPEVGRSP